jgi:hypothetical protein
MPKDYLGAPVSVDFITPFFKGLRWDVENEDTLHVMTDDRSAEFA